MATSITAFVGRARRGPAGEPTACFNFGEFNRRFGGPWSRPLSYAVDDFFANGGSQALVVRLFTPGADDGVATLTLGNLAARRQPRRLGQCADRPRRAAGGQGGGEAGRHAAGGLTENDLFDLVVEDPAGGRSETFRNLAVAPGAGARRVDRVLEEGPRWCGWRGWRMAARTCRPPSRPPPAFPPARAAMTAPRAAPADYLGDQDRKTGSAPARCAALDLFNLLCVPPDTRGGTLDVTVRDKAAEFAPVARALHRRSACRLGCRPAWWRRRGEKDMLGAAPVLTSLAHASNVALFFPAAPARPAAQRPDGHLRALRRGRRGDGAHRRRGAARLEGAGRHRRRPAGAEELTVKLTDPMERAAQPDRRELPAQLPRGRPCRLGRAHAEGLRPALRRLQVSPGARLALYIEESLLPRHPMGGVRAE